jgi:hypothetical protein
MVSHARAQWARRVPAAGAARAAGGGGGTSVTLFCFLSQHAHPLAGSGCPPVHARPQV